MRGEYSRRVYARLLCRASCLAEVCGRRSRPRKALRKHQIFLFLEPLRYCGAPRLWLRQTLSLFSCFLTLVLDSKFHLIGIKTEPLASRLFDCPRPQLLSWMYAISWSSNA